MVMGRPTLYRDTYVEQAKKLAKLGATDAQVAVFFDVALSTIYEWKLEHEDFSDALKAGKEDANTNVKRSLYQRAIGYSHEDVHVSVYEGEVTLTPIVKHYPPDPTSCIFWLKNREPTEWRDKIEASLELGLSERMRQLVERKPE